MGKGRSANRVDWRCADPGERERGVAVEARNVVRLIPPPTSRLALLRLAASLTRRQMLWRHELDVDVTPAAPHEHPLQGIRGGAVVRLCGIREIAGGNLVTDLGDRWRRVGPRAPKDVHCLPIHRFRRAYRDRSHTPPPISARHEEIRNRGMHGAGCIANDPERLVAGWLGDTNENARLSERARCANAEEREDNEEGAAAHDHPMGAPQSDDREAIPVAAAAFARPAACR